jgi:hypothetical protein
MTKFVTAPRRSYHAAVKTSPLFVLLTGLFIALLAARAAFAADNELLIKTFPVTLTSDNPTVTTDQPVRIFKLTNGPLPLEPVPCDKKFDESGHCTVDLPAGTYRFEILSSTVMYMLVAVHTPPVEINGPTQVKFKSVDLGELQIFADKDPLTVHEFGVRSIGPADENAQSPGFSEKIHLIVTPDEKYACRFVANSADDLQVYAGWESFKATAGQKVTFHKNQYNSCTITKSKDLPFPGNITATVHFPSSTLTYPADDKHRLLTNRDFIWISYELSSDDTGALTFLPLAYRLQKNTLIKLGGKLKASGYADAVYTKDGDNEGNRLFWVISLTDPVGHVVDEKQSYTMHIKEMASLDNSEWTEESPYHQVDAGKLTAINNRLRLRLTSDIPDFKDITVTPQPFVKVADAKYNLRIPGSWAFRGKVYLAKLERMNTCSRLATGRPGPAQVDINWRINFNDAWAIVGSPQGGGRGLWMSMQVNGLAVDDIFEEPWAMTHEMMHTFGYGHSPEMNAAINRALYLFNLARWQAWDNRAFVP